MTLDGFTTGQLHTFAAEACSRSVDFSQRASALYAAAASTGFHGQRASAERLYRTGQILRAAGAESCELYDALSAEITARGVTA